METANDSRSRGKSRRERDDTLEGAAVESSALKIRQVGGELDILYHRIVLEGSRRDHCGLGVGRKVKAPEGFHAIENGEVR